MRTRNVILICHIEAGRDGDRLLIAIDMDKAGQLALLIFGAHALFELSDGLHQPVSRLQFSSWDVQVRLLIDLSADFLVFFMLRE